MPDFDAIGNALAARFAAGVVTPPTGYDNIKLATADLPEAVTATPACLVFLDTGGFRTGNGTRQGDHDWTVRFYYNQSGDLARDMTALRRWLTVLVDQLKGAVQLTTGLVTRVTVDGYELGTMTYAEILYTGIELRVHAVTNEGWAAVA